MARPARASSDAELHHVFFHAVDGARLFESDDDRRRFTKRAKTVLAELDVQCLGYGFLPTHGHMFLGAEVVRLSKALQRVLGPYARETNSLRGRRGHVTWGRFGSKPVHTERQAIAEVLYVNGNSLRHGLVRTVEALAADPGSGFGEITGRRPAVLVDVDAVLSLFGSDPNRARADIISGMEERRRAWLDEGVQAKSLKELIDLTCADHGVPAEMLATAGHGEPWRSIRRSIVSANDEYVNASDAHLAAALGVSRTTIWRLRKSRS